jgi:hypothetical protein
MSEENQWPAHLPRRKLDLLDTFSGHARMLIAAAEDGARAHRTGNITESGDPFEKSFRRLLAGLLPPSFHVAAGYFFDSNWDLSSQQDLAVCEVNELVQFPPAGDMAQRYVPVTCLHVVGQLKNTATKNLIESALKQSADTIETYNAMRQASMHDRLGRPYQEPPLVVLAFGKGSSKELLDGILEKFTRPLPHYVLLLEPGLVYAHRPNEFIFDGSHVSFSDQRHGGLLQACAPQVDEPGNAPGAALLWTVFAILAKLNFAKGNNLAMAPLVHQVENRHPLHQLAVQAESIKAV